MSRDSTLNMRRSWDPQPKRWLGL